MLGCLIIKTIILEAIIFEPGANTIKLDKNLRESRSISLILTETTFEALFKGCFRELMTYAYSLLNDQAMAEEVVQQVFFKVWEKRDQLTFDASPKAYLYKSVYHHCLNLKKHQKVKQEHVSHTIRTEREFTNDVGDISNKEMGRRIQDAINRLPQQCKLIFQMSRFEDLKYREIADRLQLSVKTVEAQMGKALKQLRALLGDYITTILALITCIINN